MPPNIREFYRAPTIPQALELLTRTEAPATALVTGARVPDPPFGQAAAVVDLQALPLHVLASEGDRLWLGGLVDLQALVTAPASRAFADGILAQAATLAAHFGLRNLASVAGAVDSALADPAGPPELLLALLALGAEYTLLGSPDKRAALAAYRPVQTALLEAVTIPMRVAWHAALARVARSPRDQAIVAAVAAVSPTTARVAVAGASVAPIVVEAPMMEDRAACTTHLVAAVTAQVAPQGDYRGSSDYRRAMAEVLARRALTQAFSNEANV